MKKTKAEKHADRIRKRASALLREERRAKLKLASAERKLKLQTAQLKLAEVKARRKAAEAEIWKARGEKVNHALSIIGFGHKKTGKKIKKARKLFR